MILQLKPHSEHFAAFDGKFAFFLIFYMEELFNPDK